MKILGKLQQHAAGRITRAQIALLAANAVSLLVFALLFAGRKNYEFLIYAGTVMFFVVFIARLHLRYDFPTGFLLGLSVWGLMHMLGGFVIVNEKVLYAFQLIPAILRYDQLVHMWGFGFAALLGYYVLLPSLNEKPNFFAVSVLAVLIGMGIGALNEIVEFIMVKTLPQTNVGGYDNTMLDLVYNTIGAVLAILYVNVKRMIKRGD